ncbi:MAG: hypothetical protein JW807_04255 [Spirochaetes bacterium]|nr:hypothetical protein [Spirochaetota bacterium]
MNVMLCDTSGTKGLEHEKTALLELREGITKIYREMGNFIVKTTERMRDFRKMITPYVKYFYPSENGAQNDCFISEVVTPSRGELDRAIDAAVKIMTGDEKMNERVSGAIEAVLDLAKSVDTILELIDEIDLYAENMLIISTKYGEKGLSLARISNEVGAMAGMVNGIGGKFRDYLANLEVYRGEFNDIRRRIEVISENYLTRMKINLSMVFGEMVQELGGVSRNVNDMLTSSDEVEHSMKAFINSMQMEDVIRQKIERIVLFLDENEYPDDPFMRQEIGPVAVHLASERLGELEQSLFDQYREVEGLCDRTSSILGGMVSRFYSGAETEAEREQSRMDAIYRRIEQLKDEYIHHMEEIISGKENLLSLCESFTVILNEFEGLFNGIAETVKRFEALNMITRIELARHAKLSRTLGGALTSVMSLPVQMKRIVDHSMALYKEIRGNIMDAVNQYAENFKVQQDVLVDCIDSMKKVSVKLYESQKYYWDISQEIGRYCGHVLGFIDGEYKKDVLLEAGESARGISEGVKSYFKSAYGNIRPDLEGTWRRVRQASGDAPAGSVMAALGSELANGKTAKRVIIF